MTNYTISPHNKVGLFAPILQMKKESLGEIKEIALATLLVNDRIEI